MVRRRTRIKKYKSKKRLSYKQRGGQLAQFEPLDDNLRFKFIPSIKDGIKYVRILDNKTKRTYVISNANENNILWLYFMFDKRILYCNINGNSISDEQKILNNMAMDNFNSGKGVMNANILIVYIHNTVGCSFDINVDDVNKALDELNEQLSRKCKKYKFVFRHKLDMVGDATYYSMPYNFSYGYALCLYINDMECVSSIEMNIEFDGKNTILTTNTRSREDQRGKKHIYLLRCAFMLIIDAIRCAELPPITIIFAEAINPATTNILLSIFDDYTIKTHVGLDITDRYKEIFSMKKLEPRFKVDNKIQEKVLIYIPVNDVNKACARNMFNDLMDLDKGIKC